MASNVLVSQLVSYLRGLSTRRNNGIVTADDVHNFLNRKHIAGGQDYRLSLIRSTLNTKNFTDVGMVPSKREAAKSRRITAWMY